MKVVTFFSTLMRKARAEAEAERAAKDNPSVENMKAHEEAKREHEEYRQACLSADQMVIPQTR